MASSATGGADGDGGGGRSPSPPAAAPRAVVENLIDVRDRAEMLRNMLQPGPSPTPPGTPAAAGTGELIDGIMSSLSSAMSALDTTTGGGQGQGRRRRRAAGAVAGPGPQRRSSTSTRRRSHSPFLKTVTTSTLDDGNSWRKYGQKHIQDSPKNPRSYYRCTHKPDQGCRATRQVQASDDNPSEFVVSYFGYHTCRDPSTIPLVIQDDTTPPEDYANLISFGGSTNTMGGASTTSTHAAVDPTMLFVSRLVGYSSSLPAQVDYRCGSEEVHSGSSISPAGGELAAVVGSAGMTYSSAAATVGSAPAEYWPGGAGDMASLPSSPSSLGFMAGSFGNAGDDDEVFGFDP
ncbi:unnamed protein product [Urochloa decumbens]|uniref:WRKY domain-containing protein n=1 Tax=Urochloa decumbens TaxID=240449 RepID=A0ABC9EQ43_9POAL